MNNLITKFIILLIAVIFISSVSHAQYGNEWINPGQTYYKTKVGSNGIYKLTYTTLLDAGLPITSINPKNIQLFRNGEEQHIFLAGEDDNSFDTSDYIEFYGQYNDGRNEKDMYLKPEDQPHQYVSLYSDTSNYYLTWSSTTGKRIEEYTNTNFTGKTADPWIWYKAYYCKPSLYYAGGPFTGISFFSEFNEGEGWFTGDAYRTGNTILPVNTPAFNSSGPAPECTFGVYGTSDPGTYDQNGFNHKIEVTIGTTKIFENIFRGYSRIEPGYGSTPKLYLAPELIGNQTTSLKFETTYLERARISISHAEVTYPRNLDLLNTSYLEFDYDKFNDYFNFTNYAGSAPYIYDLTNHKRIIGSISNSILQFNVINLEAKSIVIADEADKKTISGLELTKIEFPSPIKTITTEYDYIIITHRRLANSANEYKTYRESNEGGNHKVLISFTDELYEEFYFGIHHPKALRNFCKYLYQNQTNPPKHLLLLGKGQSLELVRFNETRRENDDMVPTWGMPPSDYFFVTDYTVNDLAPAIAIGRVPARTDEDVLNYLEKVKQHESQPIKSKDILYLTGGTSIQEQISLLNYQRAFFKIAETPKLGADSFFLSKINSENIDGSVTTLIQDKINKGLNIVSYFGHGAAQILELDMGNARDFNNQGKYPLFLFNGCTLANSFGDNSLPEEFLFEKNKGAIAWIASSAYGSIYPLNQWTTKFYKSASQDFYGESIGTLIKRTIEGYQNPTDYSNRAQCRQMLFHGDPAIRLNTLPDPDYTIDPTVQIIPENYNAEMDSIAIRLHLKNWGLATTDTPNLFVSIKYSNDSIATFGPRKFSTVYNNDVADFWIYNTKFSRGYQTISVTVDYGNDIKEFAPLGETNNTLLFDLFMPSNSVSTLYPLKDGIESSTNVTLQAQLNNLLAKEEELIFEIDTTPLFNSPILQNSGIIIGQNIISYNVNLPYLDSTDFYWRVRFNKSIEEGGTWENNTFSLIVGSEKGWSQGYFSKLNESVFDKVLFEDSSRNLSFKTVPSYRFSVQVGGANLNTLSRRIRVNDIKAWERFIFNGIELIAINPLNLERYSYPSAFNNIVQARDNRNIPYHTTGQYSGVYDFDMRVKNERDSLIGYINSIPEGFVIMMVLHQNLNYAGWEEEVFVALESIGAKNIRDYNLVDPYGLISRKNKYFESYQEIGPDPNSTLDPSIQTYVVAYLLYPRLTNGSILSPIVGPATSWKEFYYRTLSSNDSPSDSISYKIIGVTKDGIEQDLLPHADSVSRDLTFIDAQLYPYLRIESKLSDSMLRTPVQQKRWTILYEGVPEGSIMPQIAFEQSNDTLQEGDSLVIKIAYQNISKYDMDSVLVLALVRNSSVVTDTVDYKKYASLGPKDSIILTYKISTLGQAGLNRMSIRVNPNFAQPEERLDNNVLDLKYVVLKDDKSPLLDVVFDGIHILDHEIVSPSTVITMSVLDDNNFILVQDPGSFTAVIQPVNEYGIPIGSSDTLHVSDNDVFFYPAMKSTDKAIFEYRPQSLASGIYNLKVQVKDGSGNKSSELNYEINFEVVRESGISNIYPYPNPFTTSMKFVYTLTGEKVPDYMKIHIMTVTGKVVREITKEELGFIKIGNNISEFSWDGTDEFGDQLANGVYLYKVTAKLNGENIALRETAGDKYFTQGFGKIYLMR